MSDQTHAPAKPSARAAHAAAEHKPVPRKVEALTDEEIAQLAQAGKLHKTLEENTHARDAALARMAAQAEADAEAQAKAVEAARARTAART